MWEKFATFAESRGFDPLAPREAQILEFLQAGLDMGLQMNTLRVQISVLSALPGVRWATQPLVHQFLKACDRVRPLTRSFVPPWDLQMVLEMLSQPSFAGDQATSLWNIMIKAVFLTAIREKNIRHSSLRIQTSLLLSPTRQCDTNVTTAPAKGKQIIS